VRPAIFPLRRKEVKRRAELRGLTRLRCQFGCTFADPFGGKEADLSADVQSGCPTRRTAAARRDIPATPSASASASGSRKPSLGQDDRWPGEDQVPRARPRRMGVHLRGRRLQPGAAAQAPGRTGMSPRRTANSLAAGDCRGRYLGSRLSRPLRTSDDHDHRPRTGRNRLGSAASRARYRIQPVFGRLPLGRFRRNGSSLRRRLRRTARRRFPSRSNSPTTMATKPSSRPNRTLLQQPARSEPFSLAASCLISNHSHSLIKY
jgi:hypothetical protein